MKALGSGGFGDVVLARHDESGTEVAIKYLRRDLLADERFAQMFRAEAAVLATLDDPHVVRLHEFVESPSGAAIVRCTLWTQKADASAGRSKPRRLFEPRSVLPRSQAPISLRYFLVMCAPTLTR